MTLAYLLLALALWLLLAFSLAGRLQDKNREMRRLANPPRPPKRHPVK
jgi:hypothetical protein